MIQQIFVFDKNIHLLFGQERQRPETPFVLGEIRELLSQSLHTETKNENHTVLLYSLPLHALTVCL